ncbi:MAG: hypothetical protein OXB88_00410 [Bacteriovoracales bacterium]|nr:hypothetical protein [Bacteriovoracales bacterium]
METKNEGVYSRKVNLREISRHLKGWKLANALWVVFSIPFVAFSTWERLEENFYKRGIQEGSKRIGGMIYKDIISKAKNEECKTIFVEQNKDKVHLVNIDCLRQKGESKPADSLAKAGKKKNLKRKIN